MNLLIKNNKRTLFLSAILALLFSVMLTYTAFRHTLKNVVELQSVIVAEIVAQQATTMRTVYSNQVVEKLSEDGLGGHVHYPDHKGYIPVPAQFLKYVGLATTKNTADLFEYKPVSKWNLESSQRLNDDFLLWAWPQLEAQDKNNPPNPIPWQPIWRVENKNGKRVMRYLWADPASSLSCVNCHNIAEQRPEIIERRKQQGIPPGKQWQQHQLLGALSITIPLDKIEYLAMAQMHETIIWIIGILGSSLVIILLFIIRGMRHKNRLATLSWQATHDALTGFYNRRGFDIHLERFWQSAVNEDKHHAICIIDLDGFKAINDTYGHDAGDKLLQLLGERLQKRLRENDVIARTGGDEFILLLEGCPLEQAKNISEGIRDTIRGTVVKWHDEDLWVSASIGVSMMDASSKKPEHVVKAADQACYISKRSGKNRVSIN